MEMHSAAWGTLISIYALGFRALWGHIPLSHAPPWGAKAARSSSIPGLFPHPKKQFGPDKTLQMDSLLLYWIQD